MVDLRLGFEASRSVPGTEAPEPEVCSTCVGYGAGAEGTATRWPTSSDDCRLEKVDDAAALLFDFSGCFAVKRLVT